MKALLPQNCRYCKRINLQYKGDAEFMRWPPQSPWATSGYERGPFIRRQRSLWAPEAAVAGVPVSPCVQSWGGRTWEWQGLLVADCVQHPRPVFRLAFPTPASGFPPPSLPPFLPSPLLPFLPFLRPSPSPPPAPQQAA